VAVSDSHNAGRTPNAVTQAPIGTGTTVVYAPELSERGVRAGVLAGRTYAKVFGPASADLRMEVSNDRGRAMIGGSLLGDSADLAARVSGGDGRTLQILRDGRVIETVPVRGDDFEHTMRISGKGDYRLQVMRGSAVDALTTRTRSAARPEPSRARRQARARRGRPGRAPRAAAGEAAARGAERPARPRGRQVRLRVRS
jgi:hypothetical protein